MSIQFLISSVVVALLAFCIILIKKLLARHISPGMQYYIWLPVLSAFWMPFLPLQNISSITGQIKPWLLSLLPYNKNTLLTALSGKTSALHSGTASIMDDFYISVERSTSFISTMLTVIWITGMICAAAITLYTGLKIMKLYYSSMPVQNKQVKQVFLDCRHITGIKTKTSFRSSAFLQSPVSFGIIRPCVIVPIRLVSEHNIDEIRYILLHELHHCKCKDSIVNYIICLTGIIYWFHPIIWYIKKEICTDREIACDTAVLNKLNPEEYLDYGNTLITFAEKMSVSSYFASSIGGTKKQIKRRIINIASYQCVTLRKKIKNVIVFTLACALATGCIPYMSVNAFSGSNYKFEKNNIIYTDYSTFFKDYKASFVLYGLEQDSWQMYNRKGCTERIAPNSTYKIYSALCALENGIITPADNTIAWDGTQYSVNAWNKDHSLKTAMQNSVNWYFKLLDKKSGFTHMQQFFHKIHYGNEDLSGGLDGYWLESSLKISPVEQVNLLKYMYTNEAGFNEENIQAVKSSMFISSSGDVSFYGKTGTGNINGKNTNGWFIGFAETPDNTFFFATNIQSDNNADGKTAARITLDILNNINWRF